MVSVRVHLADAFVGTDYRYDSAVPPYQSHRRKLADTIPVMGNIRFVSEFDDIYIKQIISLEQTKPTFPSVLFVFMIFILFISHPQGNRDLQFSVCQRA